MVVLPSCSKMPQKVPTLLLGFVAIAVLAMVAMVVSSTGRPPVYPPLPKPNGYDDFLSAAALINPEELRQTANPINHLAGWWIVRGTRKRAADKHAGAVAHLRLLAAELALRCYQAEQ